MNLNQSTLVRFEEERIQCGFIPPEKSNSFYSIGDGQINLFCERANPNNCRFHLFTEKGNVHTGDGIFRISGDIIDSAKPYGDMTVIENTVLTVDNCLTINKGTMNVHGTLEMIQGSQIIVNNGGTLILYPDSIFIVNEGISIIVEKGSSIIIYGEINVHLSMVDSVINNSGVTVDSAAVVNVGEINLGEREYSLTDYDSDLRKKIINPHTQGEYNSDKGRIGYTWIGGNTIKHSQILELSVLWGHTVLGDFKLSVLGKQVMEIPNLQVIENLFVDRGTTLHIAEEYDGYRYLRPELYLGRIIGNCDSPATCVVDGSIIVDGETALITVDRGAILTITEEGSIYLQGGAKIKSTYNDPDDEIFFINGLLVIDDISQIDTFESGNIKFGKHGKIIVLNPDNGERHLLWTTPNGIHNTDLYRLFEGRLEHIEYHISNNTGIGIDQFFDYYSRDMTDWYAGIRIEKAIHEGLIVWHSGAFIELYHDITPWADLSCSLYHAARIFKSYGSYDSEKLQEVVGRLCYVGCGNIVFRFINGDEYKDITLVLDDVSIKSVVNKPLTSEFIVNASEHGELFMRNKVADTSVDNIVRSESKVVELEAGDNTFELK